MRRSIKRMWALPLVPLWWAGSALKRGLLRLGAPPVRRLRWPVISVGSLSAGGAGKTPVVLALAELLGREKIAVAVLSRGYGRGSGVVERVDPAGTARRFGDEPLQMAQAGLPVFVGAERHAAGMLAETEPGPLVHLLDDGFQHRRLHRDVDLVLLTAEEVRDALLPAGNLRETLRALGRADVVVLRDEEAAALEPVVRSHSAAEIWVVRRELVLPPDAPRFPIVFCGIARPEGFLTMLRERGVTPAGTHRFDDHHIYADADFDQLAQAARHAGADGFLTTAKDAVKIPEAARTVLESVGPMVVAGLRVALTDEAVALRRLRRLERT